MKQGSKAKDCSIIALDKFIQATRDSGYKGTASALAELVDNSIQAGAKQISITFRVTGDSEYPLEVSVLDDGSGMDPFTLRQALRFGGSTRFDNRQGLGRYGMGLPNSSLSQARRVTVYTWQAKETIYSTYLDLDEISRGDITQVPAPQKRKLTPEERSGPTGTRVVWSRCDRLEHRRTTTLARKLAASLGRKFRYFLWKGVKIIINGEEVKALDPLFLKGTNPAAKIFGEPLEYEIYPDPQHRSGALGIVRVIFTELPIHEWQQLPNEKKRELGISKGAGVSIIRAGREVDYGWLFMGTKRRENYDDWWRCEIQFEPILDEAFGITHTKQQIRPKEYLLEALTPDLEATARALNARARKAHLTAKASERFSESEQRASQRDHTLRPLPAMTVEKTKTLMDALLQSHPALQKRTLCPEGDGIRYTIVEATVPEVAFFSYAVSDGQFVLVLNPAHPFYRDVYKPLADSQSPQDVKFRVQLELLLLASARSEATLSTDPSPDLLAKHRLDWSHNLATFLHG